MSASKMLATSRILPGLLSRRIPAASLRSYSSEVPHSDRIPANDPRPHNPVQNVSESNALPITTGGMIDGELQEMPEEAETKRQLQAPNRKDVWSRSQQPRDVAMSGPRFEQTIMEYQVSCTWPNQVGSGTWTGNGSRNW